MMIGNGATDFKYDVSPSFPATLYNFNLIKQSLYDEYVNNNCFFSFNGVLPESNSTECINAWGKMNELVVDLNWYDLFRKTYPNPIYKDDEERYGETIVNG